MAGIRLRELALRREPNDGTGRPPRACSTSDRTAAFVFSYVPRPNVEGNGGVLGLGRSRGATTQRTCRRPTWSQRRVLVRRCRRREEHGVATPRRRSAAVGSPPRSSSARLRARRGACAAHIRSPDGLCAGGQVDCSGCWSYLNRQCRPHSFRQCQTFAAPVATIPKLREAPEHARAENARRSWCPDVHLACGHGTDDRSRRASTGPFWNCGGAALLLDRDTSAAEALGLWPSPGKSPVLPRLLPLGTPLTQVCLGFCPCLGALRAYW